MTELELVWTGPLNTVEASTIAPFRLGTANRKGSFSGKGAGTIKIKQAVYDASTWTVALFPRTLFPKSKRVQLIVYGTGSSGLTDSYGRFIAGSGGVSGTNSILIV